MPSARYLGGRVSALFKPFHMETLRDCIELTAPASASTPAAAASPRARRVAAA